MENIAYRANMPGIDENSAFFFFFSGKEKAHFLWIFFDISLMKSFLDKWFGLRQFSSPFSLPHYSLKLFSNCHPCVSEHCSCPGYKMPEVNLLLCLTKVEFTIEGKRK